MQFSRREPRNRLRCTVMITPDAGEVSGSSVLGEVQDLSVHGAAVIMPGRVPKAAQVALMFESDALPDPDRVGDVVSLRASVVTCAPAGYDGGRHMFRLGLRFDSLTARIEQRLRAAVRELARGTGAQPTTDLGPELAVSAHGRERLYQHACDALDRGEHGEALKVVRWALQGEPRHKHYRALVHRITAEQALAAGELETAERELMAALAQLPDAPELLHLQRRIASAAPANRGGFFSRLFGRRDR